MAAGGRGPLAPALAPEAVPAAGTAAAGAAADEVVRRVRPTEASERRRAEVVDYARRLVGSALGCEVRASSSRQCGAAAAVTVRARGAGPAVFVCSRLFAFSGIRRGCALIWRIISTLSRDATLTCLGILLLSA